MKEFIGFCKWCGCSLYWNGPVEWEEVWCRRHEAQTELEEAVYENCD